MRNSGEGGGGFSSGAHQGGYQVTEDSAKPVGRVPVPLRAPELHELPHRLAVRRLEGSTSAIETRSIRIAPLPGSLPSGPTGRQPFNGCSRDRGRSQRTPRAFGRSCRGDGCRARRTDPGCRWGTRTTPSSWRSGTAPSTRSAPCGSCAPGRWSARGRPGPALVWRDVVPYVGSVRWFVCPCAASTKF